MAKTLEDRFWEKVVIVPYDRGCWIWAACRTPPGYGEIAVRVGLVEYAHRLSWKFNRGPIPDGLSVLHRCDNPPCVNPDHLFLGTSKDNSQDALKKGRLGKQSDTFKRLWAEKWNVTQRGEANPTHRLTEETVRAIRASYQRGVFGYKRIVAKFGISHGLAQRIVSGKAWPHLWAADNPGVNQQTSPPRA